MRKRLRRVFSRYPTQMITLDVYARHVYQYAPPATTEHLRRTVWDPLGLTSQAAPSTAAASEGAPQHAALYAVPPVTTNLRCVGTDVEGQLTRLLSSAPGEDEGVKRMANTAAALTADAGATPRYHAPFTLDRLGLPFCACVQPHVEQLAQWPPASAATAGGDDAAPVPLVVVVDAGAAEAVLRGSDLYAPGIITASRVFFAGEEALVAFYAERAVVDDCDSTTGGAGAVSLTTHDGAPRSQTECSTAWRIASALTAGITLPPAQYTPLSAAEATAAALAERSSFLVCVGSGTLCMGWKDVLGRRVRGVALRTDWTPQLQPSRAALRRLLHLASPAPPSPAEHETDGAAGAGAPPAEPSDAFFLQNYSSMVPVALLVEHLTAEALRRSCTVLDACAAPGGKTSLLLSLLHARAEREQAVPSPPSETPSLPPPTAALRVVCCERSRPRYAQLMTLLQQHFETTDGSVAETAESFLARALEPHCADTNKFLKQTATTLSSDAGGVRTPSQAFDAILLDPPCTGLGLRPKLLPHAHTVAHIQQSADYQRKLFDSCVRRLRCTDSSCGVLVYSTCTTTLEENEANVVHFLRSYPSLRLARATTAAHHALCALSVTRYPCCEKGKGTPPPSAGAAPMVLLAEEIMALQTAKEARAGVSAAAPLLILRFMPRQLGDYDDPSEDSVGFFVAVFLCDEAVQ